MKELLALYNEDQKAYETFVGNEIKHTKKGQARLLIILFDAVEQASLELKEYVVAFHNHVESKGSSSERTDIVRALRRRVDALDSTTRTLSAFVGGKQ